MILYCILCPPVCTVFGVWVLWNNANHILSGAFQYIYIGGLYCIRSHTKLHQHQLSRVTQVANTFRQWSIPLGNICFLNGTLRCVLRQVHAGLLYRIEVVRKVLCQGVIFGGLVERDSILLHAVEEWRIERRYRWICDIRSRWLQDCGYSDLDPISRESRV